jgi:hypothetical protein
MREFLAGNPLGKWNLGTPKRVSADNTKVHHTELGYEDGGG